MTTSFSDSRILTRRVFQQDDSLVNLLKKFSFGPDNPTRK